MLARVGAYEERAFLAERLADANKRLLNIADMGVGFEVG